MKILLVSEALVVGGAETFALRLAHKLGQLGHRCDLLCLNTDAVNTALVAQFTQVRIAFAQVPMLRWVKRLDRFADMDQALQRRLTKQWIRRKVAQDYDVVHTNLFGADRLFAQLKQSGRQLKLVSTMHGDYNMIEAQAGGGEIATSERVVIRGWQRKFEQVLGQVDHWVTISADQHRLLAAMGVPENRLSRIPNGFETSAAPPKRPTARNAGTLTFAMVARALPEKGWRYLVEAFAGLPGNCRLLLVGSGAHLNELAATSHDSRISFAGFHPNPVELLAGADVFVFPSFYPAESLPTVIIEALFAGLPVIATDIGEVAWMLTTPDDQTAGALLPLDPAGIVDRLRAAMQLYCDEPRRLEADRLLARLAFDKFDMERCAKAYLDVYASVQEQNQVEPRTI